MPRCLTRLLPILLLGVLGGCATVDFDAPKTASSALQDTDDTWLGRRVAGLTGDRVGESGFMLVEDNLMAKALRVSGLRLAERSIDAQYYLINNDKTGLLFVSGLLDAADRGVRVRLLLDDILTSGYDRGLLALDAHPNFELRIFNPFARRSGFARWMNFLGDFRRLNRRMHNKSFTVDNQVTLIGGRNIGDEYFAADEKTNFGDLDVMGIGPVVDEVSTMFDLYWNDRLSVPVSAVLDPPEDPWQEIAALRARIADALTNEDATRYEGIVNEILAGERIQGEDLSWVPYELVYDAPEKADKRLAAEAETMIPPLRQAILDGEREFMLITPYFVPRKSIEGFGELRERDMRVIVLTNSLAANNHAVVHSGYVPARKPLLEMGVELYEVRPDAQAQGVRKSGMGRSGGTLHAKAFIVDRSELFVGTFNWDPRSANINTEMGIILHAPELASGLAGRVIAAIPGKAYELQLDKRGKIIWITHDDGEEVIYTKEPETTWGQRFKVGFYRMLPIKSQL